MIGSRLRQALVMSNWHPTFLIFYTLVSLTVPGSRPFSPSTTTWTSPTPYAFRVWRQNRDRIVGFVDRCSDSIRGGRTPPSTVLYPPASTVCCSTRISSRTRNSSTSTHTTCIRQFESMLMAPSTVETLPSTTSWRI
ncbi:hypothetical protein PENTCL1PPCAC_10176 [Pristionchus entomophagus]|uniref:Secreted protein n=1 Tax=Pristionchus entomophagus TaxID=358040 RepID=A0AAV5SXG2_9BILA|nr:hypothetical protein PENTCL1PPCAC_10176 [Pristionchus entomophagus]